jgi:hypothetical protein
MKKKIFGVTLIVTLAVVAALNVNLSKSNAKGELALANVEALADGENNLNPGWWICPGTGWKCPKNDYGQTEYDLALLLL